MVAPAKKTQATFGSFASISSPFAKMAPSASATDGDDTKGLPDDVTDKVKEANAISTSAVSSATIPAKPPVKKSQASFGSFAASASPFSAVKHTSAFTSQPVASSSNATAHSASPFKAATGSAFGNWSASASPFATPSRKATPKAAGDEENAEAKSGDKEAEAAESKQNQQNFGDILASTSGEASAERQKVDVQQQEGKLPTQLRRVVPRAEGTFLCPTSTDWRRGREYDIPSTLKASCHGWWSMEGKGNRLFASQCSQEGQVCTFRLVDDVLHPTRKC